MPSDAAITFADGQDWPLILRLVCRAPQTVGAKRDAERQFRDAAWPQAEASATALNPASVVAGRAYAVREGYVVYWGARDHFSLRLSDVGAATVTVNGVRQNLAGLRPGQELLLDATAGRR